MGQVACGVLLIPTSWTVECNYTIHGYVVGKFPQSSPKIREAPVRWRFVCRRPVGRLSTPSMSWTEQPPCRDMQSLLRSQRHGTSQNAETTSSILRNESSVRTSAGGTPSRAAGNEATVRTANRRRPCCRCKWLQNVWGVYHTMQRSDQTNVWCHLMKPVCSHRLSRICLNLCRNRWTADPSCCCRWCIACGLHCGCGPCRTGCKGPKSCSLARRLRTTLAALLDIPPRTPSRPGWSVRARQCGEPGWAFV